jgi:hypothetical protein
MASCIVQSSLMASVNHKNCTWSGFSWHHFTLTWTPNIPRLMLLNKGNDFLLCIKVYIWLQHRASWRDGNVLDSYSGGALFESWLEYSCPDCENFSGFPPSLQTNAWMAPQFDHDRLHENSFNFTVHLSSYGSTLLRSWHSQRRNVTHKKMSVAVILNNTK